MLEIYNYSKTTNCKQVRLTALKSRLTWTSRHQKRTISTPLSP